MPPAVSFAWEGKSYRSPIPVAQAITGTRWNGRRFFDAAQRQRTNSRIAAAKQGGAILRATANSGTAGGAGWWGEYNTN